METPHPNSRPRWLNGTVLGIGLASLFADWSHEIATTLMPTFLAIIFDGTSSGVCRRTKMGDVLPLPTRGRERSAYRPQCSQT